MGKGWKSKPNLVMIPLLMEIQPNLWKPNNSMWIHSLTKTQGKQLYISQPKTQLQPKTQAWTFIAQAAWLQINPPHTKPETTQPNLAHISSTLGSSNRTVNIRFSQPQTLSSSSSEYQTPNPNSQLPTRKRFLKEFGKLKRNLRQRLLYGLFNREPKGGSETEGSHFLVTNDELENENPMDMVLEGLREAVP